MISILPLFLECIHCNPCFRSSGSSGFGRSGQAFTNVALGEYILLLTNSSESMLQQPTIPLYSMLSLTQSHKNQGWLLYIMLYNCDHRDCTDFSPLTTQSYTAMDSSALFTGQVGTYSVTLSNRLCSFHAKSLSSIMVCLRFY